MTRAPVHGCGHQRACQRDENGQGGKAHPRQTLASLREGHCVTTRHVCRSGTRFMAFVPMRPAWVDIGAIQYTPDYGTRLSSL